MLDLQDQWSWHWQEYQMLREEIVQHIEASRQLEIFGVGAVAGLYSWFFTTKARIPRWSGIIGVLIPVFGGFRGLVTSKRIDEIAGYLREIELKAFTESGLPPGWERHFAQLAEATPLRWTRFSSVLVWLVLLAFAVGASWLLSRRQMPS